jgi:hypothetical protein
MVRLQKEPGFEATMNEDRFNMAVRQFLKVVGVGSRRYVRFR